MILGCAVVGFMAAGATDGFAAVSKLTQRHDALGIAQGGVDHVRRSGRPPHSSFTDRVIVGQICPNESAGQLLRSSATAEAVHGNGAVMAAQAERAVCINFTSDALSGGFVDVKGIGRGGKGVVPQRATHMNAIRIFYDGIVGGVAGQTDLVLCPAELTKIVRRASDAGLGRIGNETNQDQRGQGL